MKNNKQSLIKSFKDKLPNIPFKNLFGKLAVTSFFLWYTNSIYKKMQFKHSVADIQKNDIYESHEQIELTSRESNIKLNRIMFYIKYLKFLTFPIFFVQLKKSQKEDRDPHLHYFKLYDNLKSSGKNIKLSYLNLDKVKDVEKEKLKEFLKLNSIEDLNRLSYFITNSEGDVMPVFIDEENLEGVKRFLTGIPKFSSLDNLSMLLTRQSDEAIHIITTGDNNLTHNIVKSFYTNSSLFSRNTLNFLINRTGGSWFNFNKSNKLQDKNEVLIMINPKYYDITNLSQYSNACLYDVGQEKLITIKDFIDSISGDDLLVNLETGNYLLCFKFKMVEKEGEKEDQMKIIVNFVESLIDANSKLTNLSQNDPTVLSNSISLASPDRYYLTNNLDLASFYKLRLFNNKEKFVFVYLNLENLGKSKLNVDNATKFFLKSFRNFKSNNQNEPIRCSYIITHNPAIAKCFNIIPKSNENVAIRFIDYSYISLFSGGNGDYKLIKNESDKEIKSHDRNLMFYYKSNYKEKVLNEEIFLNSLEQFFKNEEDFKKSNKHFLESFLDYLDDECIIKNLNGDCFKSKILDQPGKKIIFTISDNCVGCVKTKHILENLYEDKLEKENVKIFEYDTMNESIYFKKIKTNPKLFLYENSKLLAEIDVSKILENTENASELISKEINKEFKF